MGRVFDRVDEEAIGQSFSSGPVGVVKSHVWGYGHLPLWAGLATASIGAEFAILEAAERGTGLSLAIRGALLCGTALYLLALTAIQWATPTSLDGRIMTAHLLAAAGAVLLVPLGSYVNPPLAVGALALLLAVLTAAEARLARPADPVG